MPTTIFHLRQFGCVHPTTPASGLNAAQHLFSLSAIWVGDADLIVFLFFPFSWYYEALSAWIFAWRLLRLPLRSRMRHRENQLATIVLHKNYSLPKSAQWCRRCGLVHRAIEHNSKLCTWIRRSDSERLWTYPTFKDFPTGRFAGRWRKKLLFSCEVD